MVRCTPTASAISATVCCLFPSGPVAAYMRRTVAAWRSFSLGLRPPVRPRAAAQALPGALDHQLALDSLIAPRKVEAPGRPCGVAASICLLQDDQADAGARAARRARREQALEGPHGAGQPGDDEDVAGAQVGQGLVELGVAARWPEAVSVKIFSHPEAGQVIDLAVVVLAAGVDTRADPIFAITPGVRSRAAVTPLL